MACPAPLTPEHCHALNMILASIAETKELIAKCKACQLPVEDSEAANNMQEQIAQEIKRQFFPHNP